MIKTAKNIHGKFFTRCQQAIAETFGLSPLTAFIAVIFSALVIVGAVFWFFHSAPPTTIIFTSGDDGTSFSKNAEKYAKILARNGVKLKILKSEGSLENLERLEDPKFKVDAGFVQTGVARDSNKEKLLSLGSVAYEPLYIFYRSEKPIDLLSQFAGKRLSIGEDETGTHVLALELLERNGIKSGGSTTLLEMDDEAAEAALLAGTIDAAFMMSDSAASTTIRALLGKPGIRLYDFTQADGYIRRIGYLHKIVIPRGALDFGQNVPEHDVNLVGPTVELVVRDSLHPALSDLLLEAAEEVHSSAGLTRSRGEFPNLNGQEFRISPDATRYYKSGKSFLYRYLPFWLASLLNRVIVVFVPMILVLVPGIRTIPAIFRWQISLRILRCYRTLMALEKDMAGSESVDKKELLQRLEIIENSVNKMKIPTSFAEQFYVLRVHIEFVRNKLEATG
ncbi:MAG: ABC transporter substrate-binding protein [Geobacteraceae bacterium]|nr:ABC transporter substrate-binding protein [Geobacteraceae bacterium]